MSIQIPEPPDFEAMSAQAEKSAEQRTEILALIGNLMFSWSNNESVFIHYLMTLLETDFTSAAVTFLSLNTTRARLDLIRRLARTKIDDEDMLNNLEKLISRFQRCTKTRNDLNHCIYQMNKKGEITHTTVLRISESKNDFKIATVRALDKRRINEITGVIRRLTKLNRDLWEFLPKLEEKTAKKS